MRLKVRADRVLKKELHGVEGTLITIEEVRPPSGRPYDIFRVKLDKEVETNGVDGHTIHRELRLPRECFEMIEGST